MASTPAQLDELSRKTLLSHPRRDSLSLSPPKTGTLHEREFGALPVGDFLDRGEEDEAVDWILDEYLPAGGLALLAGKPKEGKTTLTYELAVRVAKGFPS